jgi:ABC-type transport system substrate-binding protein
LPLDPSKYIYKRETPDNHTFVLYVNRTDPWAWVDLTYAWIYPWHIWKNAVNLTDYLLLPDLEVTDTHMIGSGPFKWNERSPGKYISLQRHEDWHWAVPHEETKETEPSTSTTSFFSQESAAPISGMVSVFAIIVTTVIYVKRRRK